MFLLTRTFLQPKLRQKLRQRRVFLACQFGRKQKSLSDTEKALLNRRIHFQKPFFVWLDSGNITSTSFRDTEFSQRL